MTGWRWSSFLAASRFPGTVTTPIPVPSEAPFDAAAVAHGAGDMLTDAFVENGLPGHELEAETVVDHGEAPAGKISNVCQPAVHIFPRLAGREGQPALGRQLPTDALHLLPLQYGDSPARSVDLSVLGCGVAHLHQPLGAPVEGVVHLTAKAGIRDGQMLTGDKLPVEPGSPGAAYLPLEVVRTVKSLPRLLAS